MIGLTGCDLTGGGDSEKEKTGAYLTNLTISPGTLVFSEDADEFDVEVSYTWNAIQLTPTSNESDAVIQINGLSVTSGSQSSGISCKTGVTDIPITVRGKDGKTKNYTVHVNRPAAASANAKLASLTISPGALTPAFSQDNESYTSTTIGNITITPVQAGAVASIKVNGSIYTPGIPSNPVTVADGNVVTIVVTAEDNITTKTYTITFTSNTPPPVLKTWAAFDTPGQTAGVYMMDAAVSSDGMTIAAAAGEPDYFGYNNAGYIYVSSDGGETWKECVSAGRRFWRSITMSADGTRIAASDVHGLIVSSADKGGTWNVVKASDNLLWYSLSSSSNGTIIAAIKQAAYNQFCLYKSENGGATWNQVGTDTDFRSVKISGDGSSLLVNKNGLLEISADNGVSWVQKFASDITNGCIAASPDFQKLAVSSPGADSKQIVINVSGDAGANWAPKSFTGRGNMLVYSLSMSGDGKIIMAVTSEFLALSFDGGNPANWETINGGIDYPGDYKASCISGDGSRLVIAPSYGSQHIVSPWERYIKISSCPAGYAEYSGFNYKSTAGLKEWSAIASSANGMKLTATINNDTNVTTNVPYGCIYGSTDGGVTWLPRTGTSGKNWVSIASSDEGDKLAAVVYNGYIYTSTNGGTSWAERTTSGIKNWLSITSSYDGTKLAAIDGQNVYLSVDSGANWSAGGSSKNWTSITSSSDGKNLAAIADKYIFVSGDSGDSWSQVTDVERSWSCIASSDDGMTLAAAVNNGYIYISTNGGINWIQQDSPGSSRWISIVTSDDGTRIAAVASLDTSVSNGTGGIMYVYNANAAGTKWVQDTTCGLKQWKAITGSADLSRMAALSLSEKSIFVYK